jgi:4-hydroxy-3-methylbut-2-enyl diphosphate reductase
MKIILANPRGFCAGVNMAIDCVDKVLKLKGPPVYVYHEIVHNKHVVQDFQGRGVTFVNTIEEVPQGGVVVYSAHGISPEVRRASRGRQVKRPTRSSSSNLPTKSNSSSCPPTPSWRT